MVILKRNKRLFIVLFLVCFVTLCSCHKEAEKPQKTYTITYVINDHGEQLENLTEQTNLPDSLPVLSEEGWIFEGWYTTNTFDEDSEAKAGAELVEDTTLYAKWSKINNPIPPEPVKTYSVTFVTNGHGEQLENLTKQTSLPNPLPELNEEWWIFEGWFMDRHFGTPAIAGDAITKNITLYAKWRKIPTVVVNYKIRNEKAGTLIGETHQVIETGTSTTPVTAVNNIGYKFLGWNESGYSTDKIERPDEITREDTNVQRSITIYAVFRGPFTCGLDFQAKAGGRVEGATRQEVLYGGKGETVTAIPDKDFRFVRWSDGETEAVRTNDCVTHIGNTIYAEFERCERTFKLEYNEATSNTELTEYTFYLDDMEKEQYLPVPQREGYEFMGWYSDWFHTVQVTDETGRMIVDREWFNNDWIFYDRTNPDMKLFTKWKPTKEVPVYKILMIYVTEVHAALETSYYGTIQVDYVMTDIEKEFYELLSLRMEEYLEAILNGTVDFQVDTYFTKESLNEDSFYRGSTTLGDGKLLDDFGTHTEFGKIPEVNGILDNYDSVLTSFHLNDDENKLHVTAGSASKKYGDIHLEFNGTNFEQKFDLSSPGEYYSWVDRMSLYIHEFTHTIEFQLQNKDYFGIHEAIRYYSVVSGAVKTSFDVLYDYLRNEFKVEDRNVGIPYEFWTDEYQRQ